MDSQFALHLLPDRGLDQSILLAVVIGMMLLLFLTEAFGWVWVGLVVPGYLASVFVIRPAAGAAVVFESILTYLIAQLMADGISKLGSWSHFFGRERFFLIVLVSVLVRQASELWLLPGALAVADGVLGLQLANQHEFFSIGLVLVPLTANMFWKLGLGRGMVQTAIPVALTYLALQVVFLPFTNLSFSTLELTYEDVALDFLGSAKAYMILLSAAVLAARFNLDYGWDYNGILVPSLLALAWFSPSVLAISVAEALLLFVVTRALLSIPALRTINLEGPRKVFLVFMVGFVIKYALGWSLVWLAPQYKTTDFFGFGYVLTSLLAVKILQKQIVGRVLLPTVVVSIAGFVVGSGVGFALEQIAPRRPAVAVSIGGEVEPATVSLLGRDPVGVMGLARARARPRITTELRAGRTGTELSRYARLWLTIDRWLASTEPDPSTRQEIETAARALGLVLTPLAGEVAGRPAFALFEREETLQSQTGWDAALLVRGAPGPVLEVPRPLHEAPAAELSAVLCERIACRTVLASGTDPRERGGNAGDALAHPRSTFHVAHRQLRSAPIVQVRVDATAPRGRALLHLKHTVPREVDLKALWPGKLELTWSPPPGVVQQWEGRRDVSVLRVHPDEIWAVLDQTSAGTLPRVEPGISLSAWLHRHLAAVSALPIDFEPPATTETELRYLEMVLADTLLGDRRPRDGGLGLGWVNRLARAVGLEVVVLPAGLSDTPCLILAEPSPRRLWGVMAVRAERGKAIGFEAPRSGIEAGTPELASEMWSAVGADALVVAMPALDRDEDDGGAVESGNPATAFQAYHQAVHRSLVGRADALIIQVRGLASWRPIHDDLVISVGTPITEPYQLPKSLSALLEETSPLGWLRAHAVHADGAPSFVPLIGQGIPQLVHSRAVGGVDFAVFWFSHDRRMRLRGESFALHRQQMAEAAGGAVPVSTAWPVAVLLDAALGPPLRPADKGAPVKPALALTRRLDALAERARRYAVTHDARELAALLALARAAPSGRAEMNWNDALSRPVVLVDMQGGGESLRALFILGGQGIEVDEGSCRPVAADDPWLEARVSRMALERCPVVAVFGRRTEVRTR
jgi:hypothetical protein